MYSHKLLYLNQDLCAGWHRSFVGTSTCPVGCADVRRTPNPGLAGHLVSLGACLMHSHPNPIAQLEILSTVCACCKPLNHIPRSDVEGIVLAVSRFDQFFHLVICLFPACSSFFLRVFAYRLVFRFWRLLFTSSSLCVKHSL